MGTLATTPNAAFPAAIPPLSNISPFTYRDGMTFLELLYALRDYVTGTLEPGVNGQINGLISDFNARIQSLIDAQETTTANLSADIATATADIAATKTGWQGLFDAFKADTTAALAPLNDNATASLVNDAATALNGALKTLIRDRVGALTGYTVLESSIALTGAANTTTAFQSAVNTAAALGLPLRLPKGRYLLDTVTLPAGVVIEGSGPDTVLVQNNPGAAILAAAGTIAALGPLTANLDKGATGITILQNWNLGAGDLILVTDTASYAATDAGYKSGEQLRVASSTTSSITLATPVRGSFAANGAYTTANGAAVQKITPARNIRVRNVHFEGHAAQTQPMLSFQYTDGVSLDGVGTVKGLSTFALFDTARNVSVTNFRINGLVDSISTGHPSYGFALMNACHNVTISHGFSSMCRHVVTTMGGANGIPRNLIYGPDIVVNDESSTAGLDTHSAAEGVLIHGNTITGGANGISNRGRNITVTGNRVSGITGTAILVNENGENIQIEGNTLIGNKALGIRVGAGGSTHKDIVIRNNIITDNTGDAVSTQNGQTDVQIVGNNIKRCAGFAVTVGGSSTGITIERNDLLDVTGNAVTTGENLTDVRVVDNTIKRCSRIAINVPASNTDVFIANNKISESSLGGVQTGIVCIGTQAAGEFNIVGNVIQQTVNNMNRAITTTRTAGRMVSNIAIGPFASAGSEFNAGAGFTLTDNKLYS